MEAQVEYRRDVWWRLGLKAFAGVGGVGKRISDLDSRGGLFRLAVGAGLKRRDRVPLVARRRDMSSGRSAAPGGESEAPTALRNGWG